MILIQKNKKYISLKQASVISGYSSDYIGFLIRKGKIKGKRVYIGQSWQILSKDIVRYCQKNSNLVGRDSDFFKKKYISLKEASQLSGYSSDYIGQLIRSGKIRGKKIYSSIAWVIDKKLFVRYLKKAEINQEALIQRKEKLKATKNKNLILDIFPPLVIPQSAKEIINWKPYKTKFEKFSNITSGLTLIATVLVLLVGLGPIDIFEKLAKAFGEKEKIANFYSTTCSGGWENFENTKGEPNLIDGANVEEFNENNSAILRNSVSQIFCGNFNTDNLGSDDIEVKKVSLKFSWAFKKDTDEVIIQNSDFIDSDVTEETQTIKEESDVLEESGPTVPENSEQVPLSDSEQIEPSKEELIIESVPEPLPKPEPSPEPTPSLENNSTVPPQESSFWKRIISSVFAQEDPSVNSGQDPSTDSGQDSFTNISEPAVNENNQINIEEENLVEPAAPKGSEPPAESEARPEEPRPEDSGREETTPQEPSEEVILLEESVPEVIEDTTSDPDGKVIEDPRQSRDAFLEILYTLDSENWQSLGKVNKNDWQNFSPEIPVVDIYDLENLQIKIQSLMAFDDQPSVYLDSFWVEVEYKESEEISLSPEEIEKLPRIKIEKENFFKVSKEDFQLNEKPEFEINTSYLETQYVKTKEPELIPSLQIISIPEENIIPEVIPEPEIIKEEIIEEEVKVIEDEPLPSDEKPEEQKESDETIKEPDLEPVQENLPQEEPEIPQNTEENIEPTSFFKTIDKLFSFKNVFAKTSKTKVLNVKVLNPANEEITDLYTVKKVKNGTKIQVKKPVNDFRPGKYKILVEILVGENIFYSEEEFTWGVLAINIDRSIELPGNDAYLQFGVLDDKGFTICNADLDLSIKSPSGNISEFTTKNDTIIREEQCGPNNLITVPDYYAHFEVPNEIGFYEMVLTANTENGEHTITDAFEVRDSVEFDVVRSGPTRINPSYQYPVILEITSKTDWQGTIKETVPASFEISLLDSAIPYNNIEVIGEEKIISWNVSFQAGVESTIGYFFDAPDISPEFYLLGPLRFTQSKIALTSFEETRKWQIASDAVCTSQVTTGNWNTIGTWNCGHVPTTTDTVVIANTHTITIDSALNSIIGITINNGGTLNGGSATLNINNTADSGTAFTNNGTFASGTSTVNIKPINVSITMLSGSFTGSNKFNNLGIGSTAMKADRTMTAGAAFDVGGDFNVVPVGKAGDRAFNFDLSGAINVTGTMTINHGAASNATVDTTSANNYALTAGNIVLSASSNTLTTNDSLITLTGTSGTLFTNTSGTLTAVGSSSQWDVTSASGAPTIFSAATTLHILKINSTATIVNLGADFTTDNNSGNKLWIASGVLNQESRTITAGTAATLQIDSGGTLCLGGTTASITADCVSGDAQTTAQALPVFTSYTFDPSSTVIYLSDAATTVDTTPTYGNLKLQPKFVNTSRIYTFEGVATIDGSFTINPDESGLSAPALTVNPAGDITVAVTKTTSITATNSATSTLDLDPGTDYNLTTGFLNIGTAGTLDASSSASIITLSATSGTLFTRAGTFTQGTSDVQITGAGSTSLLSADTTFHKLTINNSGNTVSTFRVITINDASGAELNIQSGKLNDGGKQISGPGASNGTLTLASGAELCLGGNSSCSDSSTTATAMPTFNSYSFDADSTVNYIANAAQSIARGMTYGNLKFTPFITSSRIYTFDSGAVTINGNFEINPDYLIGNTLTVNPAGDITVASTKTTTITAANSALSILDLDPGTDYNLTTGFLNIGAWGTLDASSSNSVITLNGILGTLFTRSGTFTQGTSDVQVTSASGIFTLLSADTTFHKLTINASGATVINMGAFTPTINNVSGAQLYIQAGVFNASGADITGPGAGNGTLQIDNGATFCLGGTTTSTNATCNSGASDTTTRAMPTFQTYTFGTTSTVSYLSDADTTISETPTYGNLKLNPVFVALSRTYTLNGAMTINGDFTINPDESSIGAPALTVNAGGHITVASGKTTTITRTNSATATLDLDPGTDYNLTTGILTIQAGGTLDATSSASAINISGNYTNNGTFTAGNSTVTLNGSSTQTLSGIMTSGSAFYNLIITNSSGASASDCERTGFTAGVDFDASATIANNYTIATSNVRVEYNSTSTYTVANISWDGADSNLIYFRNSVAGSGAWLLNVSGTQGDGVSYVNVSRSDASGGNEIDAADGTNMDACDPSNNINWNFAEEPSISFSISANTLSLGNLNPLSVFTNNHTVTVTTNAASGYILYVTEDGNLRQGSNDINDVVDGTVTAGAEEYGLNTGFDDFSSDAAITGSLKIARQTGTSVTSEETTCTYKVSVDNSTVSGYYSHIVTYVVTGRF